MKVASPIESNAVWKNPQIELSDMDNPGGFFFKTLTMWPPRLSTKWASHIFKNGV